MSRSLFLLRLALLSIAPLALPARGEEGLARCEALLSAEPQAYESYFCFYEVARDEGRVEEVEALLEGRRSLSPWVGVILGHLSWGRDEERAMALYREAAETFAGRGDAAGELRARFNLRTLLHLHGEHEAAAREVERAVEVAERAGERELLAQGLVLRATHLMESGGDHGAAWIDARRAADLAFPDGSYGLRRLALQTLGNLSQSLGRFDEALRVFRQLEELAEAESDPATLALAAYSVANVRFSQLLEHPEPGGLKELERLGRAALRASERVGDRPLEIRSHRLLGDVLSGQGRVKEGDRHLERCLALAEELGHAERSISCLWTLADHESDRRPEAARRHVEEAIRLALENDATRYLVFAWTSRLRVAWQTAPPEEALRESLAALDAIEAFREMQRGEVRSAQLFSSWTKDYHWLVGRLLQAEPPMVEAAFEVQERMRARSLLDRLTVEGRRSGGPEEEGLDEERRRILREIVHRQRQLLRPDLGEEPRRRLLEELDRLEIDEREVMNRLHGERQGVASHRLAGLEEVAAELDEHEAMLSYQVGLAKDLFGEPAGGGWLLLVTRHGARAVRVVDRLELEATVPIFGGLLARRDGSEEGAAARLHDRLVAPALDLLPQRVERLIVVPDGILGTFPFEALGPEGGAPLGARFEIVTVPSATLWLRWRRMRPVPAERPALVLADPVIGAPDSSSAADGSGGPAPERLAILAQGLELGSLPYARREARAVRRSLGRGVDLRTGADASERYVKMAELERYGLLHFAAHAVADDAHPERSAVLLSPGSSDEDGLLQVREVPDLELGGRGVVLSACRTARGAVLGGEGVLSLSRAFFQSGAVAVIGSRWPLRDDEAAWFFERFYRAVGGGASLSRALLEARREAMEAELPAAAWAGVVLLGEDRALDLPVSPPGEGRWVALLAALLFAAISLGLWLRVGRRRRPVGE